MIRRPPRSTLSSSSAASDVYKRQLTVAGAEDVATALRAAGHEVAAYTGRTDTADREEIERRLRANDVKALVATSALGMGFDKPDLGFVLHLGAPSSPVAYYLSLIHI